MQLFIYLHTCSITVCNQFDLQYSKLILSDPLFRCVEVRKCHNVTIVLGAVETTLKVTDCENVSISAVCRRLLIRFVLPILNHISTYSDRFQSMSLIIFLYPYTITTINSIKLCRLVIRTLQFLACGIT